MALELISLALEVASNVKSAITGLDSNEEQAAVLHRRISIVSAALINLNPQQPSIVPALQELIRAFRDCEAFLYTFHNKRNILVELLQVGTCREKFEELSAQIDAACSSLNIAVGAHAVFSIEALREAEQRDAAAIQRMLMSVMESLEQNHNSAMTALEHMDLKANQTRVEMIEEIRKVSELQLMQMWLHQKHIAEHRAALEAQNMLLQQVLEARGGMCLFDPTPGEQQRQVHRALPPTLSRILPPHPKSPQSPPSPPSPSRPPPTLPALLPRGEYAAISTDILRHLREMQEVVQANTAPEASTFAASPSTISPLPSPSASPTARQPPETQAHMHAQESGAAHRLYRRHHVDSHLVHFAKKVYRDDLFDWHEATYLGSGVLVKRLRFCNSSATRAFVREVAALSHIQSPHVLTFYGAHFGGDSFFVIHEPIRCLLSAVLGTEQASPSSAKRLEWMRDVAAGLRCIHHKNMAHGALHPDCVVITGDDPRSGRAKLTGFGFVQTLSTTTAVPATIADLKSVEVHMPYKSSRFVAPERLPSRDHRAFGEVTLASDIYSLGLVFWCIQTLQTLPTDFAPPDQHLSKWTGTRSALQQSLAPELQPLFTDCVACEAEKRPSIEVVTAMLDSLIEARTSGSVEGVWKDQVSGSGRAAPDSFPAEPRDASGAAAETAAANADAEFELGRDMERVFRSALKDADNDVKRLSDDVLRTLLAAKTHYKAAVRCGHVLAKVCLGDMVSLGWGLAEPNKREAFGLYFQAATDKSKPSAVAMHRLATCYHRGEGTLKNEGCALLWYTAAQRAGLKDPTLSTTIAQLQANLGKS